MKTTDQEYDGALISELGVKKYLKATKDIKISNIDFLIRGAAAQKAWQECSFGCHGPTYRSLKKQSTKADFLKPLDDFSPMLAGIADGMHHQTIGQAERLAGGVKRTAEGLHAAGAENFSNVGDENTALYQFASGAFEKLVTFELDMLDNPVAQIVMSIVSEYTTALPEWLIEEVLRQGALNFPTTIDTVWIMKAAAMGVIEYSDKDKINEAVILLDQPAQRLVGKQIGKKIAVAIAFAIASAATKKLLATSNEVNSLKRRLVGVRRAARSMKGGLGSAMLTLLNAQGILNKAGESSRTLQRTCPRVWQILRYKLNGANMVYFLVQDMVQEYVDRIALLEQSPREFGKVMEALIRDKRTKDIFFPGAI